MEWSGKEEVKWLSRIRKAIKRGRFTLWDLELAHGWATCMVSERPKTRRLENDIDNEPISKRLNALGMEFLVAVENNNPYDALEIRKKILKV